MSYAPWTGEINWVGEPEAAQSSISATVSAPSFTVVPLDGRPNQTFETSVLVDGVVRRFRIRLFWDWLAGYWHITITDPVTGADHLTAIPLITGAYPVANLIEQYAYMGIGSLWVVPVGNQAEDWPGLETVGSGFILAWGDTPQ